MSRKITVLKEVKKYVEVEIDLLKFLRDNTADIVVMRETDSIEIRFPTRNSNITNCVGHIALEHVEETVDEIWRIIECNRQDELFEKYQSHIVMNDSVSSCCIKKY